jgi:hypothetical protein
MKLLTVGVVLLVSVAGYSDRAWSSDTLTDYLIGQETRVDSNNVAQVASHMLIERIVSKDGTRIIENIDALPNYPGSATLYSSKLTFDVDSSGGFQAEDSTGIFEGEGFLVGQPGQWNAMFYSKATIRYEFQGQIVVETFVGSYLFHTKGVDATKITTRDGAERPAYTALGRMLKVTQAEYLTLKQDPASIPATWTRLSQP